MSKLSEKYKCPICQYILEEPVMTTRCFHTFCYKCMDSLIKSQLNQNRNLTKIVCPICRQQFGIEEYVLAYDLQLEIENCKTKCNKCGLDIPIREFEEHIEKCGKNISNDGSIIGDYNCTLCDKKKMNRSEYVKHVEDFHSNEEGVCAICSVQPWGNKNYKTYLIGHVDLRHKKGDVSKKDDNTDELNLINQVIQKSLIEK